ncbi:MAG: flagellar biosynthesis protein FlhF [Planctomycetota bacterium]
MKLRTYQAYTMAEALAAVKRDLGAEAVILNTRSFRRGGVLGVGRRTVVQVTASVPEAAKTPAAPARPRSMPAAARRAYAGPAAGPADRPDRAPSAPSDGTAGDATEQDRLRTQRLAQALAEQHERRKAAEPPAAGGPGPLPTTAKRFILTPAETPRAAPAPPPDPPAAAPAPATARAVAMTEELSAIRRLVGDVLHAQVAGPRRPGPDLPERLFETYLRLVGQELSEELADRIVRAVRSELDDAALDDAEAVRAAVLGHLGRHIEVAPEVTGGAAPDGRPLTIALIGPTGVGKTTTVAKLAATFKLRHDRKVGLVTCDTYRIAAVDQLRTYADIIGLPLEVALTPDEVTCDTYRIAAVDQLRTYADIIGLPLEVALTPDEMTKACTALDDCDVVLIDTAGRSQQDESRIDELRRFVAAARPHETHLVLAGTAGERVLLQEAEAFARVGVDRIVLTKLDEAVSFGVLVNVLHRVGKALSFVTTGQEVPDHLEAGRPDRLAALVLGTGSAR